MEKELYLFIIWANARFMAKNLIGDIKKKFELFQAYEISWSKDAFESNLARFYGKKLPKGLKKAKEVGSGPFLALLVHDKNCQFSNGKNIAVSTAKAAYRQMLGKNLIHASDNMEETNENLLLLLGKNIKEIENLGRDKLPVCMAKTPMSFSDNPNLLNVPKDFNITVKEVKISNGAGFIVVLCGNILTMPGLPKIPQAVLM